MYLSAKLKKCISLKNYVGHKIEILVGGYGIQKILCRCGQAAQKDTVLSQ